MAVEILLAPVGTGKTEIALQRLVTALQQQPFTQVWVLVSGKRQEDAFRQRLAERYASQQVYFNVEFFTFYQLYHRLLNLAQQPPRKLDDPARFGLLRAILEQLQREGKLPLYGAIAQTPGFVRILAEFIYELKQNVIRHEDFLEAARGSQSAKDQELSLIYSLYQQKLIDNQVVDREGEGWLALDVLQRFRLDIGRDVDLLIVDGYDQFTRLQAQLLLLLAERAQKALITLTTVPGREDTIGRRFKKALKRLTDAAQFPPAITEWTPTLAEHRHPALRHLLDSLFQPGSARQPAGERLKLIEAPDPARESAAVLRQVKRLLLSQDCQPDDILIALRDWSRYARHFDTIGRVYGVPLTLHRGESIAENPAVIMLFNLINLHVSDFRRRDLLDVLRSPYFSIPGLDAEQIDQLERISQTFIVTSGRALWLETVARATHPLRKGEDDHEEPEDAILEVSQAASLRAKLAEFFDAVTPPARTTLENYVYWLDNLIGDDSETNPDDSDEVMLMVSVFSLHMPHQIKQQSALGVVERDLAAMHELKRILRGLLSGQALLKSLGESGELDRTAFLVEIQTALNNTVMNQGAGRSGRVLVTTVTDARGLPHKHVFIPGLSEGIFPAQVPEDPLYLDTERQTLGIRLETQAERAADDGLFYELISLAQETLTLSRPTVQDGVPWIASHLWRGVAAVFSDVDAITRRIGIGAVVSAGEVISRDEVMLALADGLSQDYPSAEILSLYSWVMNAQPDHWQRIHRARLIELNRASRRQPHDRYSGRLFNPNLIAYAAEELSQERQWSASQLNDYGICGFRFFAKRLLKLEALEEPEEALNAAALGTINHEILERSYREIARRNLFIESENTDEALSILRGIAPRVLANAPDNLGFRDSAKWEQEKKLLMRRLEQLIRQDFSDDGKITKKFGGPRQPYVLEAPFGTDGGAIVKIPIVVDGKNETLHLRGYIDRMDRIGDGVIVIDYKTGSTKIPVSEIEIGRNFQMMVYLRAAADILAEINHADTPQNVLGGLFWHIRSQQASGELVMDEDGVEILELAEKYIGRYIAAGRKGDFVTRANKVHDGRCTHYCEYSQLCRMGSTHRHKT